MHNILIVVGKRAIAQPPKVSVAIEHMKSIMIQYIRMQALSEGPSLVVKEIKIIRAIK